MNVNDRGTMKWTSLMLPEHIKLLEEMWEGEKHKEKPVLDDQQKAEIDMMLQCALYNSLTVEIVYYSNHDYYTVEDRVLKIDALSGCLRLENMERLHVNNIIGIQIL